MCAFPHVTLDPMRTDTNRPIYSWTLAYQWFDEYCFFGLAPELISFCVCVTCKCMYTYRDWQAGTVDKITKDQRAFRAFPDMWFPLFSTYLSFVLPEGRNVCRDKSRLVGLHVHFNFQSPDDLLELTDILVWLRDDDKIYITFRCESPFNQNFLNGYGSCWQ